MSEVNIQVQETVENVEIVAQNNVIEVNITRQSGGGGGAVDSVNGQTGVVVLDADDISDTSTAKKFVSASEKTAITHTNRSTLDAITEAFTTALKTAYDSAVTWISTNGANILSHISSTSNPHNVTKTQVGLGNVDNTSDLNKPISTATQTALNGKVNLNSIQDISLTSTIVGWSSFTTRYIGVLDLGNAFLCIIDLRGVSNNSTTSITVPFTNTGGTAQEQMRVENSGTFQNTPGLASISNGASVISFFLNNQGTSFTNSGNKSIVGQILIYK